MCLCGCAGLALDFAQQRGDQAYGAQQNLAVPVVTQMAVPSPQPEIAAFANAIPDTPLGQAPDSDARNVDIFFVGEW